MDEQKKKELEDKQWEVAMDGNIQMLIWLGKQYLGQSDNPNDVNDNELQKHPCIGNRYMLLKNGIEILKIIMDKFPISKIIVTQKGLRDAITEEIILDYEKNKSS